LLLYADNNDTEHPNVSRGSPKTATSLAAAVLDVLNTNRMNDNNVVRLGELPAMA
jgi:hypothetical protein